MTGTDGTYTEVYAIYVERLKTMDGRIGKYYIIYCYAVAVGFLGTMVFYYWLNMSNNYEFMVVANSVGEGPYELIAMIAAIPGLFYKLYKEFQALFREHHPKKTTIEYVKLEEMLYRE